jgi:hypothetical protein
MSTLPFRHRALAFVRDRMDVHTDVLPQTKIEDEHGNARVEGAVFVDRRASALNLASLWTYSIAAVVALVADRPLPVATHDAVVVSASVLAIVATILLAAAFWARRRARRFLWIDLRGDAKVEPAVIEAIVASDRPTWVMAEHGFTPEALAAAARLSVRCFATHDRSFAEVAAMPAPAAEQEVAA